MCKFLWGGPQSFIQGREHTKVAALILAEDVGRLVVVWHQAGNESAQPAATTGRGQKAHSFAPSLCKAGIQALSLGASRNILNETGHERLVVNEAPAGSHGCKPETG